MLQIDDRFDKEEFEWHNYWVRIFKQISSDIRIYIRTDESFYKGFTNLFDYIIQSLDARLLPTSANVISLIDERPPHIENFLNRGGTVAYAVLTCFDRAIKDDLYLRSGDHEEAFANDVAKLPYCRNDREFAFVRRQYRKREGLKEDPT
ncbi:MAG: hypothetical protein Q9221_009102 [Calogaya cf. arnoldii]